MALHYNLAKVYARSLNDDEFTLKTITVFVSEIPFDLKKIKDAIEVKDHQKVSSHVRKIIPIIDLMGMNVAFEELLQMEEWTKNQGKRKEIKDTYKSVKNQIFKAIKEVSKDFNVSQNFKL